MAVQAAIGGGQGARGVWWRHGFPAENAGDTDFATFSRGGMVLAQLVAQLRQQRVMGDLGQIVYVHFVRKALAASFLTLASAIDRINPALGLE